ncbi:TetR-like C-terminal domain-containing protein [Nonomuraea aridisoli]|nr:TetR-like C-terminal domain-containing protein [Nonomuraea aridisoli]
MNGLAVLRLAVALSGSRQGLQERDHLLAERARQFQVVLDRARDRGEHPPDALGVVDHILAPMYIRVLSGAGSLTPDCVDGLVDRLL